MRKERLYTLERCLASKFRVHENVMLPDSVEKKEMTRKQPKDLYLDTNAIDLFPLNLEQASLIKLRNLCEELGIVLNIPEPVFDEWIEHHRQRLLSILDDLNSADKKGRQYLEHVPERELFSDLKFIALKEMRDRGRAGIKSQRINLVQLHATDVRYFFDLCIKAEPPFKLGGQGKGFKDSVILHAILENARSRRDGAHWIVSGDGAFSASEISIKANAEGISIEVLKGLSAAIEQLEGMLGAKKQKQIEDLRLKVRHFLSDKNSEILAFVRNNVRFSFGTILTGEPAIQDLKVKSLKNIEVVPEKLMPWKVTFEVEIELRLDRSPRDYTVVPRFGDSSLLSSLGLPVFSGSAFPISTETRAIRLEAKIGHTDETLNMLTIDGAELLPTTNSLIMGYLNTLK